MLKDRLKTASVLIGVTLLLTWLDANYSHGADGIWLVPLLLFMAIGSASDMSSLLQKSGRPIYHTTSLIATAIVMLSAVTPMLWPLLGKEYPVDCPVGKLGWIVVGSVLAIFWVLIVEMWFYAHEEYHESGTMERTCGALFVSLYIGLPMSLLVSMRSNWGIAAIVTVVAVTKGADAGAYFTGKLFGRHKLVPRLSPGKTYEGAIGGIVTATIVAFACLNWLFPSASAATGLSKPLLGALLLGPLLAITGMIGDLAESLIKRECGAKDSGNWLPGLGGVWDVTDSLIAAVMPAFLCFSAGVGGP